MFHHGTNIITGFTENQSENPNEDQIKSGKVYERYINKITKVLNKKVRYDLYDLYDKN